MSACKYANRYYYLLLLLLYCCLQYYLFINQINQGLIITFPCSFLLKHAYMHARVPTVPLHILWYCTVWFHHSCCVSATLFSAALLHIGISLVPLIPPPALLLEFSIVLYSALKWRRDMTSNTVVVSWRVLHCVQPKTPYMKPGPLALIRNLRRILTLLPFAIFAPDSNDK